MSQSWPIAARRGAVRRGPAISDGRSGWSKGARASRLRGEGRARNSWWSEAVGRRAHGGGVVAIAEEEGSTAQGAYLGANEAAR
jgi:hypothetical protein